MRRISVAAAGLGAGLAAVLAWPAAAAPDADAALRERVRELVEMLATGDESSRALAADELAKLGRAAVPHVGRVAHLLGDAAGRRAAAAALARIGAEDSLALLQAYPAAPSTKDEAARKELVAALRALRDPKLAVVVELAPSVATNAARVPPDAAHAIGDTLPEALAWGEFAVKKSKGAIQVDVEGGGARFENVDADRPRALRVGPRKRPILVFWRLDRWHAASASLLAGKQRGEDVELWDADLDGAFDGPKDFIRFGDGAFQRIEEGGLVLGAQGLATMDVKTTESGALVTLVPEPLPEGTGRWTVDTLAVVNEFRRGAALPPVLLNLARTAACEKHVEYWRLNGYTGHDEASDRPGYTAEGAQAGKKSSVWDTSDGVKLARVIGATVLHRASLLGAAAEGEGIAIGSGTCLWGGELDASRRGFPVLVPGPGEDAAPAICESEQPPPDRDRQYYAPPRGFPVTVLWRGAWNDVKRARLELFAVGPLGAAEPVPGDEFTPEHPYSGKGRQIEIGAATFVAAKPLDRRRAYVARFRCERDTGPVEFTWTFSTK
jgi:hypothetical protein